MLLTSFLARHANVGAVFVRLLVGGHVVQATLLRAVQPGRLAAFGAELAALGLPLPVVAAAVSVYVQVGCGLLILAGVWVRSAAAVLALHALVVLVGVHLRVGASYAETFPTLAVLAGAAALVWWGAGPLSLTAWRERRRRERRTFRRR